MAFDKFKKLYDLQKQAKQIQRELRDTLVEAQNSDGSIKVIFNAEQKIESIVISDEYLSVDRKKELEETLMRVIQDAIFKVQKIASARAKDMMGGLGLPGM